MNRLGVALAVALIPGSILLIGGLGSSSGQPRTQIMQDASQHSALDNKAATANQLSQLLLRGSYPVTQAYLPLRVHAGIDFGSTGDGTTSVYAPVSGLIEANTSACGKVAIYDGQNTIILAHMTARTALAVGSQITAGTYIGKASKVVGGGCTATAAHLHIEIRKGRNGIMAAPANDNRATTLDPLGYPYDLTPPSISIVSPAQNFAFSTGSSYRISWTASDPSGLGDVAVDLISNTAASCSGSPASLASVRLAGQGYVSSVNWTVPTSIAKRSYKLKVAARDNLNNWGCTMIPVSIR